MNTITSRTKFTVEMTYDGRKFRKTSPTGCWTTYQVEPMTLAEAEFVCEDHRSRGTTSEFVVIDVEYEASMIATASKAKTEYLIANGWDGMTRDEKKAATELRKAAIEVFVSARDKFITDNPQI